MRTRTAVTAPARDDSGPARALRWVVRATLALAVLGFWPSLLGAFTTPKAIGLRVLGGGLLVAAVADVVRARFDRSANAAPRVRPLDLAAIALVAVAIASTLFGLSPRLSWLGEIGQREGLATVLALAGVYAGARRAHASAADVRGTVAWIAAVLAACAAYALVQVAGADPISWAGVSAYGAGVVRSASTAGNPNLLGALLATALALATARVAQGGRTGPWAALAALASAALVGTLSRGAWLAAGAGVAGALAFAHAAAREERRAFGRSATLALGLGAVPALAVAIAQRGVVAARLAEDVGGPALSSGARLAIARGALALWRERPWLGVGPDAFGLAFPRVQPRELWANEWLGLPAHAHSAALQVLATLGALGALAMLAALIAIAWDLVGAWRARGEARPLAVLLAAAWIALIAAGAVNVLGLGGATLAVVLAALSARGVAEGEAEAREAGGRVRDAHGAAAVSAREAGARADGANIGAAAASARDAGARARGANRVAAAAPRDAGVRANVANIGAVAVLASGALASVATLPASVREWRALAAAGEARVALEQSVGVAGERGRLLLERTVERADRAVSFANREDELWRLAADAYQARGRLALALEDTVTLERSMYRAERAATIGLGYEALRASNEQRRANAAAFRALFFDRGYQVVVDPPARAESLRRKAVASAVETADSAFARAERLAPMDALIRVDEARAALQLRRWDRALATAEAIVRLYPDMAGGLAGVARARLSRGERAQAQAALRRALAARWEDGSEAQHDYAVRLLQALDAGLPVAH